MRTVNTHEAKSKLSALLAAVEEQGETILICRNGKPIAELKAPASLKQVDPLRMDSRLKVQFSDGFDPTELATEEDWPSHSR